MSDVQRWDLSKRIGWDYKRNQPYAKTVSEQNDTAITAEVALAGENAELRREVETWRTIARSRKDAVMIDTITALEAELAVARAAVLTQGDRADALAMALEAADAVLHFRDMAARYTTVESMRRAYLQLAAALDAHRAEAPKTVDAR